MIKAKNKFSEKCAVRERIIVSLFLSVNLFIYTVGYCQVKDSTGSIFISTIPGDAEVAIDGIYGVWKTPVLIKNLYSTRWVVRVAKPKYDTQVIESEVVPDSTLKYENVRLSAQYGSIDFQKLQGMKVFIDGNSIPKNKTAEYSRGKHLITIDHKKYGIKSKEIMLAPGEIRQLMPEDILEPGIFDASTDVPAHISINGERVGDNTVTKQLTPGEYKINFFHETLGQKYIKIDINPGEKKQVFVSLLPSSQTAMWLCTIPGASQLYVGQKTRGYIYLSAFIASVGASVYFIKDFQNNKSIYDDAIKNYNNAQTSMDAVRYRNQINSKFTELNNIKKNRETALLSIAAVYVVSLLDHLIFSPEYGYRKRESSISMDIHSNALQGISLTWRIMK
jgi:hypothetical protein